MQLIVAATTNTVAQGSFAPHMLELVRREPTLTHQMVRDSALSPVSVVMVVHNGEPYVEAAIDSILAQTHSDFEFVVVDDGSTDRTPEMLAQYAARDRRLRIVTQQNLGQAPALNRALATAKHEWVAIIDHDDISFPHRLERQLRALAKYPEVRLLGSHAVKIDADGRPFGVLRTSPTSPEEFWRLRQQGSLVSLVHPSVMMHRPTILALGGYRAEFGVAADTELWSRIADDHLAFSLSEPLIAYRLHGQNMSIVGFFDGQEMLRWIAARQRRRRSGKPEPTLTEFRQDSQGWLGLRRLNHRRQDWLIYAQWQARLAWRSGRHPQSARLLALATILGPIWVARRAGKRLERRVAGVIRRQKGVHDSGSDVPLEPAARWSRATQLCSETQYVGDEE